MARIVHLLRPTRRAAALLALALAGCALGPDFERPTAPPAAGWLASDEAAAEPAVAASAAGPWWQAFGSSALDTLVADAVARSASFDAALATLRQSEAALRAGEGAYYPEIDASFGFGRQKVSAFRIGATPIASSPFNLYTLGVSIGYALDLFGTRTRTVEGLRAQTEAQRCATAAAYLTLTANVVNTAIAAAAYERELAAVREQVALQRDLLAIVSTQARAGLVAESALQAQRQQLAQAQAALAPLEQRRAQTRHLLAQLGARTPAEPLPPLPRWDELQLGAAAPAALPSELVRERPDILQAEAQLHAASAALGVASAALWPAVTLSASPAAASPVFGQLDAAQSRFWSLGASADVALYKGGALNAQRDAAEAALHAAQSSYRQVVLAAFAQVGDSLTALQHDTQTEAAQADTAASARRNRDLMRVNAAAGLASRQQLRSTELALLQAEVALLQAQAQRLQDSVALYTALGGRWWSAAGDWARPAAIGAAR